MPIDNPENPETVPPLDLHDFGGKRAMCPKARRREDVGESSPTSFRPTMLQDATQVAEASNGRRGRRYRIGIEASFERLFQVLSANEITQVLCRIFATNLAVFGNLIPTHHRVDS